MGGVLLRSHHEVWEADDDPRKGAGVGHDAVRGHNLLVQSSTEVLVGELVT